MSTEQPTVRSSLFSRKARPMEELLRDSGFAFHVGQLVGAVEIASHWLLLHEDAAVAEMGRKLEQAAGWYFEPPGS